MRGTEGSHAQTDYGLTRTKGVRRCPSHGARIVADFHAARVGPGPWRL